MLSIGKLGSDPDPASYYLEVVASGVEDYYLSTDEVPGRWLGPAAPSLGLARPVEPEDLRAGLDGRHPRTGDPLGQRRRVPGFDLTLSAPRSVSLLWGLDAPAVAADVAAAHDEAVDAAMAYLEDRPASPAEDERGAGGSEAPAWWRGRSGIARAGRGTPICTPTSWWPTDPGA